MYTPTQPRALLQRTAQRGAALIVALILLIVITLVGLAAVSTTLLQNTMAANAYDRQIAFQSAEAGLRVAATWTEGNTTDTTHIRDCTTAAANVCSGNPFNDGIASTLIQTVPPSGTAGEAFNPGARMEGQPQYVVEYMGVQTQDYNAQSANCQQANSKLTCGSTTYSMYRITVRSGNPSSSDGRAVVTLQTIMKLS